MLNSQIPYAVNLVIAEAEKLKAKGTEASNWKHTLDWIIDGVVKFKQLGDAVTKFDASGYVSLGWSAVSVGLHVMTNAKRTWDFALSSSEIVTEFMTRYAE